MVTAVIGVDAQAPRAVFAAGDRLVWCWFAGAGLALLLWPDRRHLGPVGLGTGVRRTRTPPRAGRRASGRPMVRRTVVAAAGRAAAVAAVVVALASVSVRPPWLLSAGIVAATAIRLVGRARADRRTAADLREATAALHAVVRELRAGMSPADAARRVAVDAPDRIRAMLEPLAAAASGAAGGIAPGADAARPGGAAPLRGAAGGLAERLAAASVVAQRVGVPLADVVSALATDLADRAAARRARAAQVAGPAVSGYVLAALPVAGLLLGAGMGSDPLAVLGSGAVGGGLLVAGVALCCGGLLWADRIVRGGREP